MATRAKRYATKTVVINFRIQPPTKAALQKAAAASGRTVSAEAEHQLQRALSDLGGAPASKTAAVMMMIAKAIDGFVGFGSPYAKDKRYKRRPWLDDPYSFDQAARLVVDALEMLRPRGEPLPEGEPLAEHSARFAIESTLNEIRTADPSVPFGKQTPYQRWLILMRQDLGPLADRPSVFGFTADKARKLHALAEELIPLSQKNAGTPDEMTPAETQRLAELWGEVAIVRSIP